jgi:GAF domain-containing protein
LLRERLSYYHVGIFLIDENQEFAVLRAASGEAGQLMIANNHKLKIGEVGMVGYVTKTGEPRIALDVGADAVHFHNPLLPYTRSEMTLPLEVRGKVIGAVDIQSDKVNAFSEDDITIMQILTDQLSVTVEKEDLIRRLTQNISTVGQLSENYTLRTWESFTQQALAHRGYRYRGVSLEPLEISEDEFEGMLVSSNPKKKTDGENRENAILNVPIRLRDQVIGVLNIKFQEKKISSETKGIIEQAAGRLAIALENARLVQDAQHLAEREKQMNIISAQVQQSTNLETVLQNTIRELGNALGVPNTFIQIGLIRSEDKE